MSSKLQYHPGPPDPLPEERLLLMDDVAWEYFIETCARQLQLEGQYQQVIRLGGSGDKGRDVCGYTALPPSEGTWDLYQAKYYGGTLSPSRFAPELAKFLWSVLTNAYPRPRLYYICALKIGATLVDLILNPEQLRGWILKEWRDKNGNFDTFKEPFSTAIESFIGVFPFGIVQRLTPSDLLDIHSRNAPLHWEKFGVLAKREPDPDVPDAPDPLEQRYVAALFRVYAEYTSSAISTVDSIPITLRRHFRAQRRLFYSAEGLNRFSRDKLPGAFAELLDQIEIGIGTVVAAPHPNGLSRLQGALSAASTLSVNSNPLHARLSAGDLPGGCHHLANQERVNWVVDDED